MDAGEERVTVVDARNCVVGSALRREMRADNLPHRATYVLVFNSKRELFVQKRTMTKDVFPGYDDAAAGGVVLAGESYLECAVRELEEEMGIRGAALETLFEFYFEHERARVWGQAFACVHDGELVLQADEVESGRFIPVARVLREMDERPYTPDGAYVLRRYVASLPGSILGP